MKMESVFLGLVLSVLALGPSAMAYDANVCSGKASAYASTGCAVTYFPSDSAYSQYSIKCDDGTRVTLQMDSYIFGLFPYCAEF